MKRGDVVESVRTGRRGRLDWVGGEYAGVIWEGVSGWGRQVVVNRVEALRVVPAEESTS